MKPLYLSTPVREALGPCLRPGGEALSRRLLELLAPGPEDLVVDAGCGPGATLGMLQEQGVTRAVGLDLDPGLLGEARAHGAELARADLARMPLLNESVDMVLAECSWNLTAKEETLAECARVLRPGGALGLSDIYLRSPGKGPEKNGWPSHSCFFQATDLESVQSMVWAAGFEILLLEDHSPLLTRTAAEFVFAHGSLQAFWQAVMGNSEQARAACTASATSRPGLFLLIAVKPPVPACPKP
ncbi:DVU_1556 family methyltransferase [Desulfogranum mediterraneum]|uniref:DVU_1556 family methyltransferase n=1 Tax=Desulfogranum mediterraneum TaxID=160661 RepID=UPI00041B85FE|nr:class I SAM-dependent methyltransferase [Desulfogranum mediterraneum]